MLLDCRSLDWRAVPLPLEGLALVICDSSARRAISLRPSTTRGERNASARSRSSPRSSPACVHLRDVDEAILARTADRLDRRDTTPGRTRHQGERAGRGMRRGPRSRQSSRPWAGSSPRAIALCATCMRSVRRRSMRSSRSPRRSPGTIAARMTGAGFGGCTINLVARDAVDGFRETISRDYPARTGLQARVFTVEPAAGAGLVP